MAALAVAGESKGDEGRGDGRGRDRVQGARGIAEEGQGDEGAARQAAAGVARRGAVASFSSAFWREKEDNRQGGGWAGPASTAGRTGRWAEVSARLVLLSLSLLFSFCFLFMLFCFDLVYNPNYFNKS